MIRVLWPHRFRLLILMGLTVLLSILAMCSPLVTRAFIDNVIGLGQKDRLAPLTFWRVFLVLALPLFGYLQIRLITYVGQRFVFELRNELYDHMLDMSLRFFSKHSTGKLVNRLMGDTGKLANMLSSQTMGIISDLACSAFAVTATVALNWRLSLVIWVVIAVFLINYRIYNIKLGHMSRAFSIGYDHMAGGIQNRLTVGLAVKSFGAENREQIRFEMDSAVNTELSTTTNQTRMEFSQNSVLIQNLSRALLYFLGCAMVLQGEMTYGDVTAFTAYALQLLGPAVRFSELAQQLQEMRIALERIMEVFEERPELPSGVGWKPEQRVNGQVYFQQVNFGYSADRPVIRDFELNVKAGETIALVGPTGCGKSTILLLLMRFFDTQQGSVLLDGRNVKTFDLRALRSQFGIVLQEPLLFHISIADNIRYARSLAPRDAIERAARAAEIHDFILSLPQGYDTLLGSEGLQLSVGQKQRLTIARAILADPAILIMDEATSALDSESEAAIQKAMRQILAQRTAFIVAHRLSTIRDAHRIVLLDKGQILEIGNHDQLMALPNGRYRALYLQYQNKGVIRENET